MNILTGSFLLLFLLRNNVLESFLLEIICLTVYMDTFQVTSANPMNRYAPVQLPRAEMKPYSESYFTDTKPFIREEPVEGYVS